MKILITGSNGLTGHKIVFQAIEQGFNVMATSYNYNNLPENNKYKFELLDITNKAEIDHIIGNYNPDVIINTAGITKPDDCEKDNIKCRAVNIDGVKNLVDIANKIGCKLIHFSTDFIFSGNKGMYSETDIPNPQNYYAQTKLESEQIVKDNCNKYVIIRTVLVYGYSKYLQKSNFVLWVKNNLEQNKPIKVVNDQYRTPTLVDDLAKATLKIVEKNIEGIYHISGNEYLSVYEFAIKVANILKLNENLISPIASIKLNEIAKRPAKTGFNITKAYLDFNYTPTSLNEGINSLKL